MDAIDVLVAIENARLDEVAGRGDRSDAEVLEWRFTGEVDPGVSDLLAVGRDGGTQGVPGARCPSEAAVLARGEIPDRNITTRHPVHKREVPSIRSYGARDIHATTRPSTADHDPGCFSGRGLLCKCLEAATGCGGHLTLVCVIFEQSRVGILRLGVPQLLVGPPQIEQGPGRHRMIVAVAIDDGLV